MKKTDVNSKKPTKTSNIERTIMFAFLLIFVGVIAASWMYAMTLKQTIAASNAVPTVDVRALIEVEKLRNLADSQISNSRSFFLLGSSALFDEQKKEKQQLKDSLANFQKQFSLPQVSDIIKNIDSLEQQQQEVFDQAMKFREERTESKIVGQFYQSKTSPLRTHLNQSFDEIVRLHNSELEHSRERAKQAASGAEVQIPRGMTWFTGSLAFLFFGMTLLIMRLLRERKRQLAERSRLYEEAKKAVIVRDEILVAVSQDLKEPLEAITDASGNGGSDAMDVIKSSVAVAEGLIKDIHDQAKADAVNMTLRLDQLPIDSVLDDARLMLQPLAKQRDVRLQFDSVNPPALAFYDRERVMRILSNLVGNAIKFSPKNSKVVVKVRSDQQFVYISVTDNGAGIPENQLAEIFDNFWQARKTAEQGAGVGLAIVKTIVEAHGGIVKVESRLGQGSTFTFSLPRRRPVGAQLGKAASAVRSLGRPSMTSEFQNGPGL